MSMTGSDENVSVLEPFGSDAARRLGRRLPPVAARVDGELAAIDEQIDWLHYLSPLDNDAMWQQFVRSSYRWEPKLRYPAIPSDFVELRHRLAGQVGS